MEDSEMLTEETMINPHTPLPSFLEMCLIDSTTASGQAALSSSLEAIVSFLSPLQTQTPQQTSTNSSINVITRIKHSLAKFLSRYNLEIQALITYFMEKQCLISNATGTGGGTIGESVYGAMRSKVVPVIHIPSTNQSVEQDNKHPQNLMALLPLTQKDCIRSAFFMAFAPYIKNKLEKYYNDLKQTNQYEREHRNNDDRDYMYRSTVPSPHNFFSSNTIFNTTMRTKIEKLFYMLYPYLHMTHQGTLYYYQLSYLLGNTIYYSPYLAFLKVMVRRVTTTDRERNRLNSKKQNNNNHKMEKKANVNSSSNKLKSNSYNSSSISNASNITSVSSLSSTPTLSSSLGKNNHNGNNTNIENNHSHVKSHSHRHGKKNDKHHIADIVRSTVLITLASVYLGACFMKLRQEQRRIRRRHRILSTRRNQSRNHTTGGIIVEDNNTIVTNPNNRMNNEAYHSGINRNHNQQHESVHPNPSLSIPVPPPPQPPRPNIQHTQSQIDHCPLCKNEFVNPTASCSGHVFCYRCLVQYLRDVRTECPVTKRYCRESDIIPIYEST